MFLTIKDMNDKFFKGLDFDKEVWYKYQTAYEISNYGRMKIISSNKIITPNENGFYSIVVNFTPKQLSVSEIKKLTPDNVVEKVDAPVVKRQYNKKKKA
jgi:hypothetical protein